MSQPYSYFPTPEEEAKANKQMEQAAERLRIVAAEFDLDIEHANDPARIYVTIPRRIAPTYEEHKALMERCNQRIKELQEAQA